LVGNGSRFIANPETEAGIMLDWGQIYASAVLDDVKNSRTLLWGWVLNQYDFSKTDDPPFDGALSLPRVMDIDPETSDPTWDIAPEVIKLRTDSPIVTRHVTVRPGGSMALDLPDGVAGDTIEIMVNVSSANASEFGLSVSNEN
jgi:sucrose-6-phosphate hydrolase SacC (GH32 family)